MEAFLEAKTCFVSRSFIIDSLFSLKVQKDRNRLNILIDVLSQISDVVSFEGFERISMHPEDKRY